MNAKRFLQKCAKMTSVYGQNHKVATSERYWALLTKEKLSGVILNVQILPTIEGIKFKFLQR